MATRIEREKQQLNELNKIALTKLVNKEENKYCADCLTKGPRWVSWNLGVLICIRCSGIHRSLGVHISRVKSVNLDTWTKDQIIMTCSRGNGWAKEYYEANLPQGFKRPTADAKLELFIRDKYERKKYCSNLPVRLRSITEFITGTNVGTVVSKSARNTRKERTNGIPLPGMTKPALSTSTVPRPKSSLATTSHHSLNKRETAQTTSSNITDLLSLDLPASNNLHQTANQPPPSSDLNFDLFTSSRSNGGSTTPKRFPASAPKSDQDHSEKKIMSKDTIMSLYSHQPAIAQNPFAVPPQYNVPVQMAIPYQQQPAAMATMNMGYQGVIGYPQQQNIQAMQQLQWQQQQQQQQMQLQQQMQRMQISGAINNGMHPSTPLPTHSSMPQMNFQQQQHINHAGYGFPPNCGNVQFSQHALATSHPSMMGLNSAMGGWGANPTMNGQSTNTNFWQ